MKKKYMISGLLAAFLLTGGSVQSVFATANVPEAASAASFQRQSEQRERPSMITNKLIKKLNLTDEQVEAMKAEEAAFNEKMEAMRPDRDSGTPPDMDEMREKMDALNEQRNEVIKGILTAEIGRAHV